MEMGSTEVLQEWGLHMQKRGPTEKDDLITSEVWPCLESSALRGWKKDKFLLLPLPILNPCLLRVL